MSTIPPYILGIWDGHDAGAAVLQDGRILAAVNEERLTRRKLEVGFPRLSVPACLAIAGVRANDIACVALSTWDVAKTLTRVAPALRNQYYDLRRRHTAPTLFSRLKKYSKYSLTLVPGGALTRVLGAAIVRRDLRRCGITAPLQWIEHHAAHAAAAALCSGFDQAAVLTLDGIGDSMAGSVSVWRAPRLERVAGIRGRDSLGIFFEHVTNLMNMRELEDEGKVMALANYALPVPDAQNPMLTWFACDGLSVRCRYGPLRLHHALAQVLYQVPSEQFAFMAQRTLEVFVTQLVRNAVAHTGIPAVCIAGGVASNVKVNMLVRELECVRDLFVFPHMGDGGLAVGAALALGNRMYHWTGAPLDDLFLGQVFSTDAMEAALRAADCNYTHSDAPWDVAADALARGDTVLWFDGRMEFGPRALGHRSILTRADDPALRDRLNLQLKQRVWYQPFCPSILADDAARLLEHYRQPNRFMTEAYRTTAEGRRALAAAISIDGTCRPQIVDARDGAYARLLQAVRARCGVGAVLNTSMNIHGDPMVNTPAEAIEVFQRAGAELLVLGPFVVRAAT
jgi:carbamoyltransferase